MKCQRRSGQAAAFASQLLGPVLPHQRHARLGEHADVLDVEVLDRGEQLDVGRVAAGAPGGGGDLLAHAGDVLARPARV